MLGNTALEDLATGNSLQPLQLTRIGNVVRNVNKLNLPILV